ncbi:MAG: energy-coupling factor transporter transmembrane protein EcfT [Rhodobacteraceae bacterium]|nr:energy-coupling factor transporter transmembrane protein EcfT [Paracoccaceae bacterium]
MLTLTAPQKTIFHEFSAGQKLLALCVVSTALFQIESLTVLACLTFAVIALYLSQGLSFAKFGVSMLWPLWPFVLIIVLYHGITHDIAAGGEIILRMLIAVALANLVTMTTALNDMIDVLMGLLRPLNWIGISTKPVALTIALFIRFIPTLIERGITINAALRARSTGKSGWRIIVPLTLSVLNEAEHVANALRARGGVGTNEEG